MYNQIVMFEGFINILSKLVVGFSILSTIIVGGNITTEKPTQNLPEKVVEVSTTSEESVSENEDNNIENLQTEEGSKRLEQEDKPDEEDEVSYIETVFAKQKLSRALVNIYCTLGSLGPSRPITASGVIIRPEGVIITNAHVAQYVLIDNFVREDDIDCQIRGGSPAKEMYEVKVLYISPEWVEKNRDNIFKRNPTGTGKDDYAFLLITDLTDDRTSSGLKSFPFVGLEVKDDNIKKGDKVLVGGYPAGILDSLTIQQNFYAQTALTEIETLFTFDKEFIDLISLSGSYLSQQGSSGGGVMNENGDLIGIVVTSTQEEEILNRDLRAITIAHINESLKSFSGFSLERLLVDDLDDFADEFGDEVLPLLADILLDELEERKSEDD